MIRRTLESLRKRAFLLPKIDASYLVIAVIGWLVAVVGMALGLFIAWRLL